MLGIELLARHPENLRCRERMNVLPRAIGLDQQLILGEVRQQPQLNLRVVGLQQNVARLGNEGSANLAAQLGANRNVL